MIFKICNNFVKLPINSLFPHLEKNWAYDNYKLHLKTYTIFLGLE